MAVFEPEASKEGLLQALLVYAEPLAADARVAVLGGDEAVASGLRDLGARHVHVAPSGVDEIDVRDGAFDLVIVPDLGAFADPATVVRRLRRVVAPGGATVALARARTEGEADADAAASFPAVAAAALGYGELYDLFALQFDSVTMSGVLPFEGVVFAQLGVEGDVPVGVDARLVAPPPPSVFVVVASRDPVDLDPYTIVQVPPGPKIDARREREAEAALAAAVLEAKLLAAQLEEQRARSASLVARSGEGVERVRELEAERAAARARLTELGVALAAAQAQGADRERRLAEADAAILERDDAIAALQGELDALQGEGEELAGVDPELVRELTVRAQRAETALALNVADLAHVSEAHATETAVLEAQLRERARLLSAMEKEIERRDLLVRELVAALEEARESGVDPVRFEAAPVLVGADPAEAQTLRRKLDELALEIARREGELVAQAWQIEELENAKKNAPAPVEASPPAAGDLAGELSRARDEIDALRQALTQEHAARQAVESGEELARARAELARQAVLLEQLTSERSERGVGN